MLGLRLSVLLLGAPADLPAPPEAPSISASTPTSGRVIVRVWLRGAGLDAEALAEAVATRLTDKQILAAGQAAGPIAGLVALCHVTAQDGQLVLEVILGDGRVYQRKITAPAAGRYAVAPISTPPCNPSPTPPGTHSGPPRPCSPRSPTWRAPRAAVGVAKLARPDRAR